MAKSCYEILGLSGPSSNHSAEDIKVAYKKSLLLHHPDKSRQTISRYSVDEISDAYETLSDVHKRSVYDRELRLHARQELGGKEQARTGLETVDLDDLTPVGGRNADEGEAWSKPCRCGRTYILTESQLEQEADKGELYIPCEGCSLWLRVLFQLSNE